MESDIKVSICCLTYNHEKYIEKTLNGFLMQRVDFKYEIIVHDDASTDSTAEIVRSFEKKAPGCFAWNLSKRKSVFQGGQHS